jgi:ubiquinone/menaquinone biosynthesis C-methylase UbiE
MERLGYPDERFDAIVSVFSIFFVSDMASQVRELWRMVRPGGSLAITTWGPRMFEPGASAWCRLAASGDAKRRLPVCAQRLPAEDAKQNQIKLVSGYNRK